MATETDPARGHWKALSISYEEALSRLHEALFRRYRIFGACNPAFAHTALQNDPCVGVLLPCNVVLYEEDDGKAVVGAHRSDVYAWRGRREPGSG